MGLLWHNYNILKEPFPSSLFVFNLSYNLVFPVLDAVSLRNLCYNLALKSVTITSVKSESGNHTSNNDIILAFFLGSEIPLACGEPMETH